MNNLAKLTSKIYISHILMALVSVLAAVPLFNFIQSHPCIYSAVTGFISLFCVYSLVWHKGTRDSRNIPGSYPDKKVPLKLSIYISIVPVILLIIRLVAPNILNTGLPFMNGEYQFLMPDCQIYGTPDFIYRLWYFSYAAFIPSGNILVYFAEIFVLPVVIFAGYHIGLKRFSLYDLFYKNVVLVNKNKLKSKKKKR